MRPIPAPRIADAVAMPDGDSRDWIAHPGPADPARFALAPCHARRARLQLAAGTALLDAVAAEVEAEGADGACAILDGVPLSVLHYVLPDGPVDDGHAAWFSETRYGTDIRLDRATASVGKRDGAWFMHSHAIWADGAPAMGHLLNESCMLVEDCAVDAWLLSGACLTVAPDPETRFPLFRPVTLHPGPLPSGPGQPAGAVQAALLTLRPHEDLRQALETACAAAGFASATIHGIGSLIGAGFGDAPAMAMPISEVLLLDGCRIRDGRCTALPVACVDPTGAMFQGDLGAGKGAVCVTFELLLLSR